jgi:hypothetical protein
MSKKEMHSATGVLTWAVAQRGSFSKTTDHGGVTIRKRRIRSCKNTQSFVLIDRQISVCVAYTTVSIYKLAITPQ